MNVTLNGEPFEDGDWTETGCLPDILPRRFRWREKRGQCSGFGVCYPHIGIHCKQMVDHQGMAHVFLESTHEIVEWIDSPATEGST